MKVRTMAAILGVLLLAPTARADEAAFLEKVEQLERRVQELEDDRNEPEAASADWSRHVQLSGSANAGFFGGESDSAFDPDSFLVWDARFFVDAELGGDVQLGDTTLIRNLGFTFEWDLVRLGRLKNRVGELYTDFQSIGDSSWLSLQVGRFQIPVGENYLRFSKGYSQNPFISNTVGGPWYWDEGVRLYGSDRRGRFGYVASVSDGDTSFNTESDSDKQTTLKLFVEPTPWLHLSASALRSGKNGNATSAASGALWLGESWARAFGASTSVANYIGGVEVPDGPNELNDTILLAADAIVTLPDRLRLWLAYGRYQIDSSGGSLYDATLHYWIAELILYGGLISPELAPFHVGLRANALGTYDDDEGYLLDSRYKSTLGYNMESLTAYSVVLGWQPTSWVNVLAEYTHQEIELVRGVTAVIRGEARQADYFAIEVGIHF